MGFRLGRRAFVSTGLISTPLLHASARARLRIGWLSVSPHPFVADFRDRLRQLGYVEGENLVIEYRYANGDAALLPALVDELLKARREHPGHVGKCRDRRRGRGRRRRADRLCHQ